MGRAVARDHVRPATRKARAARGRRRPGTAAARATPDRRCATGRAQRRRARARRRRPGKPGTFARAAISARRCIDLVAISDRGSTGIADRRPPRGNLRSRRNIARTGRLPTRSAASPGRRHRCGAARVRFREVRAASPDTSGVRCPGPPNTATRQRVAGAGVARRRGQRPGRWPADHRAARLVVVRAMGRAAESSRSSRQHFAVGHLVAQREASTAAVDGSVALIAGPGLAHSARRSKRSHTSTHRPGLSEVTPGRPVCRRC